MLFRETVAVYCENHTEHINTLHVGKMQCSFNDKKCGYLCVIVLGFIFNIAFITCPRSLYTG
jgi:hypothetical protein